MNKIHIYIAIFILVVLIGCDNPFAPSLKEREDDGLVISDQMTVEGVFQNWRFAYNFKDTVVYGNLLDDNFYFVYINYDNGVVPVTWGRQEEMITTAGLFKAAYNIDLLWNESLFAVGDSLNQDITRGFNLTVYFSLDDAIRVQGRAIIKLGRKNVNMPWKILYWRDESNF